MNRGGILARAPGGQMQGAATQAMRLMPHIFCTRGARHLVFHQECGYGARLWPGARPSRPHQRRICNDLKDEERRLRRRFLINAAETAAVPATTLLHIYCRLNSVALASIAELYKKYAALGETA